MNKKEQIKLKEAAKEKWRKALGVLTDTNISSEKARLLVKKILGQNTPLISEYCKTYEGEFAWDDCGGKMCGVSKVCSSSQEDYVWGFIKNHNRSSRRKALAGAKAILAAVEEDLKQEGKL